MEQATNPQAEVVKPSVEERIANYWEPEGQPEEAGDESLTDAEAMDSTEPEGQPQEPEAPVDAEEELSDIEFEGRQYKVPAEIKDALLRQSDYTKKTQEVAEQRKTAEALVQRAQKIADLQQSQSQRLGQLASLDAGLEQFRNVDWNKISQDDPSEANRLHIQYTRTKELRDSIENALRQEQAQQQEEYKAWVSTQVEEGNKVLQKELKSWTPEVQKALVQTALEYGFKPGELNNIVDTRQIKILHDAHQWRKLQASKVELSKKTAPQVKTLKPNASEGKTSQQQNKDGFRRAIRATKDEAQKARHIQAYLESKF